MNTYRKSAITVGALYILGTVFGVSSALIAGGLSPGDLAAFGAAPSRYTLATFFIAMMGLSLASMAVFLYPVLRKHSESLAMGMLVFRGPLEGLGYAVSVVSWLILIELGKATVASGANTAALQSAADVIVAVSEKHGDVSTIIFITGATFLYVAFYRSKLIPRWLSLWGLIGAVPYLAVFLLRFFGVELSLVLVAPLALQEIAMGLWLIIAGFNADAVAELEAAA